MPPMVAGGIALLAVGLAELWNWTSWYGRRRDKYAAVIGIFGGIALMAVWALG